MPSSLTYPGVYVEEIPSGVRSISGVSTSVAAFVDYFRRGLANKATRIFSFGDFEREFGGLDRLSEASYGIQQFFLNGGTEAWVVRCVGGAAAGATLQSAIGGATSLSFEAGRGTRSNPGTWGQQLRIRITPLAPLSGGRFNAEIILVESRSGREVVVTSELFSNLSIAANDLRNARTVINDEVNGSKLARLTQAPGGAAPLSNGTLSTAFSGGFPGITSSVPQVLVSIGTASGGFERGVARLSTKPTSLTQARALLESAIRLARPERAAFADASVEVLGDRLRILPGPSAAATQVAFAPGGSDPLASNLGLQIGDTRECRLSGNLAGFTQPANDLVLSVTMGAVNVPNVTLLRANMADLASARAELESKVRAASTTTSFSLAQVVLVADGTERRLLLVAGSSGASVTVEGAGASTLLLDSPNSAAVTNSNAFRLYTAERRAGRQSANLTGAAPVTFPPAGNLALTITMGTGAPVNLTLTAASMPNLAAARVEFESKVRAASTNVAFTGARVVLAIDGTDSRFILLAGDTSASVTVAGAGSTTLLMDAANANASNESVLISNQLSLPLNAPAGARLGLVMGSEGASSVRINTTADTLSGVAAQLQAAIRAANTFPTFTGAQVIAYDAPATASAAAQTRLIFVAGGTNPIGISTFAAIDGTTHSELRLSSAAGATTNVQLYAFGGGSALAGTAQGSGTPGTDALPDANALIGDLGTKTGIRALEDADLFNLLCIPRAAILAGDAATANAGHALLASAISYCERRRAFLLVDTPTGRDEPEEISQWVDANASLIRHKNAALFYPRVKSSDPLDDFRLRSFGASGTMAGLFARIDSTRGVWKAPAGTEAVLRNVAELEDILTDQENGALNPLGINCLRTFPVYGNVAWGARTLDGSDQAASEWKYIPVRRMALFIEESLYRGLKWAVFEPNDEPLWAQVRLNVGAFMQSLFRQGAFQGSAPRDAYFVKCDKETTTQNDINLGIVNVLVGFAPLKPAEFVVIKLQQMAGQIAT